MMAPGTCGRSRFPDVRSPAVSYGALCGAAATKAGGSTSDTSSHELGDRDKPTPTHPRPLSHDLKWLHARDRRARWWSVTTSNFLSLCRPISLPTSPQERAVFQSGRILRKGSELHENAARRRSDCVRNGLLSYSAAGESGTMHHERLRSKNCSQSANANQTSGVQAQPSDGKHKIHNGSGAGRAGIS